MKKILIPFSAVLSAMLLLGACAHTHQHERDRDAATGTPTLGQQLQDLKDAYDSKAISKKEYNDEKKKLLKDY
jgi:hypothetical protein